MTGTEKTFPASKPDLIVSPAGTLHGSRPECSVIKDPVSNRYFSLTSRELCILRLCDGTKSVEEIARAFNQNASSSVSEAAVGRLIDAMEQAGLFQADPIQKEKSRKASGFALLRKLVFLKIKTINPDRFLEKCCPYVRPFFTPQFALAAITLIVSAIALVVIDSSTFRRQLTIAMKPSEVMIGWSLCFGIAILHELAHGFACKHWGGQVKSMGLLFLYFNPALYCDVSDAWLFVKRSQRLWTMAAGGFLESFIWAILVWIGAFVPLTESHQRILNFMILFTGIKIIINLNPLIKLDGYYILSDALAIPNLRSRAFKYTRQFFKKYLFGSGSIQPVSRKEAVSFVLYCMLAGPFSLWLAVTMLWRGAASIAAHHWKGGWILIAVLVLVALEPLLAYVGWLRQQLKGKADAQEQRRVAA